jgi:hypothetical protein
MTGTQPDIAYAVSTLSKFATRPGSKHVTAMKHLFRYLKGTTHLGITFSRDGGELTGYSDSDYAADPNTRKSVSGTGWSANYRYLNRHNEHCIQSIYIDTYTMGPHDTPWGIFDEKWRGLGAPRGGPGAPEQFLGSQGPQNGLGTYSKEHIPSHKFLKFTSGGPRKYLKKSYY